MKTWISSVALTSAASNTQRCGRDSVGSMISRAASRAARSGRRLACVALLAAVGRGQAFEDNVSQIPQGPPYNDSYTENVDFADVDLDGDLDVMLADGGDSGNDQTRLWINMGGAQGGTVGYFEDETATRLPAVLDSSRDVDLVDIDRDGDRDLYVSNSSQQANQSNRWWINMGGRQGGTAGFFQDQTSTRWVRIAENNGQPGPPSSSIAPSLKLPSGGFIDWSCDCSFADLDDDGDLDLVHTSYGSLFGARTPSRLFLNDGGGFFEEFNPSGFQLSGTEIKNLEPGLWCQGQHQNGALDFTGKFCDIADDPLGVDLGDLDGDFDVDILHGARDRVPRVFDNRLEAEGTLAFRDVSHLVFPPNWAPGTGHYEQELGDLDDDADLDIYGVNWANLCDSILFGEGGSFAVPVAVETSCADDNEADFLDFDGDGDLDVFLAQVSGPPGIDRLYENTGPGGGYALEYVPDELPVYVRIGLGADGADVDLDGDTDIVVASGIGQPNTFLKNLTQTGDVHAPRVARVEFLADRAAGDEPSVVRAHVYDNAAWYGTARNATTLEYRVDGGAYAAAPMAHAGGQVFRGTIPGELVGQITYRVRSSDPSGNTGLSLEHTFESCGGDVRAYCTAKTNSCGDAPVLTVEGTPSSAGTAPFFVRASGARAMRSGLVLYSGSGAAALPFQGGFLCVAPGALRRSVPLESQGAGSGCDGVFEIDWNAFAAGELGGQPAGFLRNVGQKVHLQWWGRDTAAHGSYLSGGLRYAVCP